MNRRTLLGRFSALRPAVSSAQRPDYFRAMVEPLEARQLLSVSTLTWVIDPVLSTATNAVPDQLGSIGISGNTYPITVRFRDQSASGSSGTWTTGNQTNFSGTLAIDYVDGSQLQFRTGLNNYGYVDNFTSRPDSGVATPNPGFNVGGDPTSAYPNLYSNFTFTPNKHDGSGTYINNTSEPAAFSTLLNATISYPLVVFGVTTTVPITADTGYLSFSQMQNDALSGVLPITAGSFDGSTTNLGAVTATVRLHGLNVAGVAQTPSYNIIGYQPLSTTTNGPSTGTITSTGTLTRKIVLPLSLPETIAGLTDQPITGTITGQIVATATLTAPTVDLNGNAAGTGFTNVWTLGGGPVSIGSTAAPPANAQLFSDTLNMAATNGLKASMATFHTGDVLAANTTGTSITATYSGGTLTLNGTDTTAHYEQVLDSITYNNTGIAGPVGATSVTVKVFATDGVALTSAESDATINISVPLNTAPTVDLNGAAAGTGFTSNWNGVAPVVITDAANATVMDDGNLASMTVTLASPATGDVLAANTAGTSITAVYAAGVLTLTGVDTPADYQTVLRTVTYNNTAGGPGVSTESATVLAIDNGPGAPLPSNTATATININTAPTVDLNGAAAGTSYTASWSGSAAVAITDAANATVTDNGTTLASTTVTLTSPHTGDVLAANTSGTSITQSFAGGVLTLSGVDTLADYQTVLRTVTYNNTSGGPGVAVETATVVANDGFLNSTAVTSTINMPAPSLSLTAGAGSGAPNYTTSWYNQGSIPTENNVLATVTALSGVTTLSSIKVTLATFHTGDVLALAPLGGVSLALTSSYSAGTLTLSGTDTVGHYQQALRFINYNNTVGGPGATPIVATFVANDGTHASNPVTSTININVGSGQVLGNRLFYNNSKYDGNSANIGTADDAAVASDKTGYNGTGTATFANVSAFNKGITGIMVDLQSGLGTHTAITAGDISFKVSPATFVTTTYNQLSTWSAGPAPAAVSVRIGAGQGGSDRLEITFGTSVVKQEWLEVNVHSGGNTGLSANDVFYFGSIIGDSSAADTVLLAKTDGNDYNVPFNNIVGLTTPVWNLADYTKDGKTDGSDATTAIGNVFTLHYLANPTGPFAPNGGGSAAPAASPAATPTASASGAVSSGLSILNSGSINVPTWLSGRLQSILTSPPVTKAIQSALQNPQILNAVEQVASKLHLNEDVLDGLLKDLGI